MGADLICFIVKGPKTLPEDRNPVIAKAAATMRLFNGMAKGADRLPTSEELVYLKAHPQFDVMYDIPEYPTTGVQRAAKSIVKRFYHWWEHGARDTSSRVDPDDLNSLIVVAGDQTWGDTPDGVGYELLNEVKKLDLFEVLGLR